MSSDGDNELQKKSIKKYKRLYQNPTLFSQPSPDPPADWHLDTKLTWSQWVWSGLGDKSLEIIRCRRVSIKHNAHYIVHLKTGWRRCRRWQYLGYPLKHSSPRTIKPLFEQNGNLRKYFPKSFLIRPRRFNPIWIKNWLIDWRLPWHWE